MATNQPDTKSNRDPNYTTKQQAVVSIRVKCPVYPEKFIRDNVVSPFLPLSVVIIPQRFIYRCVIRPTPFPALVFSEADHFLLILNSLQLPTVVSYDRRTLPRSSFHEPDTWRSGISSCSTTIVEQPSVQPATVRPYLQQLRRALKTYLFG